MSIIKIDQKCIRFQYVQNLRKGSHISFRISCNFWKQSDLEVGQVGNTPGKSMQQPQHMRRVLSPQTKQYPCPFGIFTGSSWYRDPGFTGRLFISKILIFKYHRYYQSNPFVFMRWIFFIMTTAKFGPFLDKVQSCLPDTVFSICALLFWPAFEFEVSPSNEGVHNCIWVEKWETNLNIYKVCNQIMKGTLICFLRVR